MYIPKSFALNDTEQIRSLIQDNSFATLVTNGAQGLQASHLPFEYDVERGVLFSHLARANPQWRDFSGGEVLAIFTGPHGYISPSWYETDLAVPTWNYTAVHIYGTARVIEDDAAVTVLLERLVAKYESTMPDPWRLEAPEEWQANMRRAIVGFEVVISRIEAKAKLSQNRPVEDIRGAISGVGSSGQTELAELMRSANAQKLAEKSDEN